MNLAKSVKSKRTTMETTRSNREARNKAEKQRRERYNTFIKQLSNELPIAQSSGRRIDKISILRLTAAFVRLHQSSIKNQAFLSLNWNNGALNSSDLMSFLLEAFDVLDGFVFFSTSSGSVLFVSPTCTKYLGHHYTEMLGMNIQKFLHPTDVPIFEDNLKDITKNVLHGEGDTARFSQRCRMRIRNQPRSDNVRYQSVNIHGLIHSIAADNMTTSRESNPNTSQSKETCRQNSLIFFGLVQVIHPEPWDLSFAEANDNEYRSRLTLDGMLVDVDHRISLILGFTPREVYALSAYDFIHPDDVPISLFAHKQMLKNSNGTGVIVHRLATANGGWVYIRSAGKMEYDSVTNKVYHFFCCSTWLMDEQGREERNRFLHKFTPHIKETTSMGLFESLNVDISSDFTDVTYSNLELQPQPQSIELQSVQPKPAVSTHVSYIQEYAETPLETIGRIDGLLVGARNNYGVQEQPADPLKSHATNFVPNGSFHFLKQLKDYYAKENGSLFLPQTTWTKVSYSIRSMTNIDTSGNPITGAVVFECSERKRNRAARKRDSLSPPSSSASSSKAIDMGFWEGFETQILARAKTRASGSYTKSAKRCRGEEGVHDSYVENFTEATGASFIFPSSTVSSENAHSAQNSSPILLSNESFFGYYEPACTSFENQSPSPEGSFVINNDMMINSDISSALASSCQSDPYNVAV